MRERKNQERERGTARPARTQKKKKISALHESLVSLQPRRVDRTVRNYSRVLLFNSILDAITFLKLIYIYGILKKGKRSKLVKYTAISFIKYKQSK